LEKDNAKENATKLAEGVEAGEMEELSIGKANKVEYQ
jgi:hypothetical protein